MVIFWTSLSPSHWCESCNCSLCLEWCGLALRLFLSAATHMVISSRPCGQLWKISCLVKMSNFLVCFKGILVKLKHGFMYVLQIVRVTSENLKLLLVLLLSSDYCVGSSVLFSLLAHCFCIMLKDFLSHCICNHVPPLHLHRIVNMVCHLCC